MQSGAAKCEDLKDIAREIRRDIVTMLHTAQSGHPGGSLSATEIVTSLYFKHLRIDSANPNWVGRDRLSPPRATVLRWCIRHCAAKAISRRRSFPGCGNSAACRKDTRT